MHAASMPLAHSQAWTGSVVNRDLRDADETGQPRGKVILGAVIAVIASITLVVVLTVRGGDEAPVSPPRPPFTNTPFTAPGIHQPATVAATAAQLDGGVEVIGISAGGKHRAYVVRAFNQPFGHVVNDLFGDIPVTVTYCDRCDVARAFTSPQRGSALEVMVGGWLETHMLLRVGDRFFPQDDEIARGLPLTSYPHERTTWQAWKTAHPETDVYTGVPETQVPNALR
jgi:hypothetical protein